MPSKNSTNLRMQHTSLQFSDPHKQQRHDTLALFRNGSRFPVKTGTEAGLDRQGENMNRTFLQEFAEDFNHIIHFARDNWIAVDREIIERGSVARGNVFVVDSDKTKGKGHDSVMATLSFAHRKPGVGMIHQGAVHYPTQGRFPDGPNWKWNKLYAQKIDEWMREVGKGSDLAFVNGDFNMNDKRSDWSFGGKWTSMADELKAHENTGHGPIDGFASYDKDGRVEAVRFNVIRDKKEFMYSDHFICRGVWRIKHLKL